jgi:nitrous oxidase accessory protein NosD
MTRHVPAEWPTIQAGINAAIPGDTVLVASGTYSGAGNKNLNPMGKAIAIVSESGAESTIIDCELSGRGIYFQAGEGQSTIFVGFTVRKGRVTGSFPPDNWGGGVLCIGSSPSIRNCVIRENITVGGGGRGGGLALFDSSPTLSNCTISQNGAAEGGGIHCHSMSAPSLIDCTISESGSGIFCDATSSLSLPGSTITQNGVGIYFNGTSGVTVEDAHFAQNSGGAIDFSSSPSVTIKDCTFQDNGGVGTFTCTSSSPAIVDCLISGGSVGAFLTHASPTFLRCTFVGHTNTAIVSTGQSAPHVESCTFYQNGRGLDVVEGVATVERTIIAFSQQDAVACSGGVAVSCCDFYANLAGNWTGCIADQQGVNGNFTESPRFCDALSGDFTLNSLSPCAPGNSPPGCGLIGAFPVACGVTGVPGNDASVVEQRLIVSPNPVRGAARFSFLTAIANGDGLRIFDSQGRLVKSLLPSDGHWEWAPTSSVPAGIYFARTGSGVADAVKFLVLR